MFQPCPRRGCIHAALFALIGLLGGVGHTWAQPFVYVAEHGSDTIPAYRIAADTGALTPVPGPPFASGRRPCSVTVTVWALRFLLWIFRAAKVPSAQRHRHELFAV